MLQITPWTNTMTVWNDSGFQTVVKCDHLKVFLLMGAWRGGALFTFVYHCDFIARVWRCTLRGRRCWLQAGDTEITADNSALNLTCLIATTWMIALEWKLTTLCVRSRGWTRHHANVVNSWINQCLSHQVVICYALELYSKLLRTRTHVYGSCIPKSMTYTCCDGPIYNSFPWYLTQQCCRYLYLPRVRLVQWANVYSNEINIFRF